MLSSIKIAARFWALGLPALLSAAPPIVIVPPPIPANDGQPVPPLITGQPAGQTVFEGAPVSFLVTTLGTEPFGYQWALNTTNVVGATNASLVLPAVGTNQAGLYSVVITNQAGSVTSAPAALVVYPRPTRQLQLARVAVDEAGQVTAPVELISLGDERQVSFTVTFNPAALTNARAVLLVNAGDTNVVVRPSQASLASVAVKTDEAPAATLTVDASRAAQGQLGLALTLPTGAHFTAGLHPVLNVLFDRVAGHSLAEAGLSLGDGPLAVQVRDAGGNGLFAVPAVVPTLSPAPIAAAPDPQSGLFTQLLTAINPGSSNLAGLRILVHGLGNDSLGNKISLFNAAGATNIAGDTNGVPYLQFGPLAGGASVDLALEFYVSDRKTAPTPQYEAQAFALLTPAVSTSIYFSADRALFTNGVFVIEFPTLSNRAYYVQYQADLSQANWTTALPGITGTGSRMQWVDSGPPKTASKPGSQTNRFYRIIQFP